MVFEDIKKNLKDKIYYEEPNIIIINDDCLNAMKGLPDKYFDLCLTDPPYGVGKDKWDTKSYWYFLLWNFGLVLPTKLKTDGMGMVFTSTRHFKH